MGRLRAVALIGAVAIVLLTLVCLLYLVIAGKDLSTIAPVLLGFATPTVTTLLVFGTLQGQMYSIEQKIDDANTGAGETNHDN